MLSVARSRYALPSQFVFLVVNAIGLLVGIIYNSQTPDLYENNAHHKIGWIVTWVISVQVTMALIFAYAGRGETKFASYERAPFLPVATEETTENRWSGDSGQGTERNSSSLRSCPTSPSCESPEYDGFEKPEHDLPSKPPASRRCLQSTFIDRFLAHRVPNMLSSRVLRILNLVYNVVDRLILPFGFIAITTGAVTYGGIMVGDRLHFDESPGNR